MWVTHQFVNYVDNAPSLFTFISCKCIDSFPLCLTTKCKRICKKIQQTMLYSIPKKYTNVCIMHVLDCAMFNKFCATCHNKTDYFTNHHHLFAVFYLHAPQRVYHSVYNYLSILSCFDVCVVHEYYEHKSSHFLTQTTHIQKQMIYSSSAQHRSFACLHVHVNMIHSYFRIVCSHG